MMTADETRGGHSPIFAVDGGRGKSDPMMVLAVMVILVIFIFVIFAIFAFKGERRHGGEGIAEIAGLGLALSQANKGHGHEAGAYAYHMAHDNMRDNLREFGELKKEIALTHAATLREIDQVRFDNYKVVVEQNEKNREQAALIERDRRSDEYARSREDNLYHRITARMGYPRMTGAFAVDDYSAIGAVAG